ncbi:ABCG2 [Acrasis kona]|uniref:ABCG2 n=1 Tax=Acrasis kona TaxID=1008807 RepID=A0AAW2YKI3_9EUKA
MKDPSTSPLINRDKPTSVGLEKENTKKTEHGELYQLDSKMMTKIARTYFDGDLYKEHKELLRNSAEGVLEFEEYDE